MGGGAHRPGVSLGGADRPFLVVAGPTASGKSALALAIAREFSGTVINADSMQVYRELAILTSRPGPGELAAAPHRLYGVLSAAERCSAGRWRDMALGAMGEAPERLAIVTGGTGLYLRALMQGLAPIPQIPQTTIDEAATRLAELGVEGLHAELARADPGSAARLKPGDTQRVLRAWSVHRATGRGMGDWQAAARAAAGDPCLVIAISPPRETLYAAIDARFQRMVEMGAMAEAKGLLDLGLDPSLPAMKAVGVRELGAVLAGRLSLDAAIAAAQQVTRRYAKRQLTWIRHQLPGTTIVNEQFSERILPGIFNIIRQFLLTLPV